MPVPAIMTAAAVAQGIGGFAQRVGGANMRRRAESQFDKFEIPGSVMSMLDIAHGLSSQTEVPGADVTRSRVKGQLSQGIETAERVAESGTDVLGAIRDMFGSYQGFEQDLVVKGEQFRRQAKEKEMSVLSEIGKYETQRWQYNELLPFMSRMNAAQQMEAAGGANIQSAISTGMNVGMTNWDLNEQQRMFDQWKEFELGKIQN